MYHIKDDKRSQASAKLVLDAMDTCLRQHPFEEISITEVCREATVSRATFYRLFDTLEDVVAYRCECFAIQFYKTMSGQSITQIMEQFFSAWMAHSELLELILCIGREDILLDCHHRYMELIQYEFQKIKPDFLITEYHISILTSVMLGMLTTWIHTGKRESVTEIVVMIQEILRDFSSII